MRILVIDNNIDPTSWGAADLRRSVHAVLGSGATVFTRRAPADDLPRELGVFDRIVISGSKTRALDQAPWIENLLGFIRKAVAQKKPVLGVCYGHQMLARALGGTPTVRESKTPEVGWTEIEQAATSGLFKTLPKKFYSYSYHFDEIAQLPTGSRRLAFSKHCAVQAFEVEGFPVFGIQFHPEKIPSKKIKDEKRLFDSNVGEVIFKNFLTQL